MRNDTGFLRLLLSTRGLAGAALVLTAVLAAAVLGAGVAKGSDAMLEQATTTDWPVNANGQTYGSEVQAKSEADVPDLVLVEATNGKQGYCLNSQLNPAPVPPKSEAEAKAMMREALCKGRVIPVFESDGVTRIGVFQIGGPGCQLVFEGDSGVVITKSGKADGSLVTKTQKVNGTTIIETDKADGTVVTKTVAADGTTTTVAQ